ncbi:WXG100 family type VII secretion target [Chloroflexus sp.]|uniref:WXG100 family type VII secretion target n=1 Tax=Chloroflexus sp. TaxID=1904827 RepID=UPI00404A1142
MPSVSIDTDQARSTAATFDTSRSNIENALSTMSASVSQLLGTWQGSARQQFENEWEQYTQQLRSMLELLQGLANGLRREADEFEAAGRNFTAM